MSITIQDENDNSPQFDITSDVTVDIPEDTPIGQRVAMVLARDKDARNNGLVRREREIERGGARDTWVSLVLNNALYLIASISLFSFYLRLSIR